MTSVRLSYSSVQADSNKITISNLPKDQYVQMCIDENACTLKNGTTRYDQSSTNSYSMPKKYWPILYTNLLHKMGHYFLDI